jgi:hypothetical protein
VRTGKLVKILKPYICRYILYFDLEAETNLESAGKHVSGTEHLPLFYNKWQIITVIDKIVRIWKESVLIHDGALFQHLTLNIVLIKTSIFLEQDSRYLGRDSNQKSPE